MPGACSFCAIVSWRCWPTQPNPVNASAYCKIGLTARLRDTFSAKRVLRGALRAGGLEEIVMGGFVKVAAAVWPRRSRPLRIGSIQVVPLILKGYLRDNHAQTLLRRVWLPRCRLIEFIEIVASHAQGNFYPSRGASKLCWSFTLLGEKELV